MRLLLFDWTRVPLLLSCVYDAKGGEPVWNGCSDSFGTTTTLVRKGTNRERIEPAAKRSGLTNVEFSYCGRPGAAMSLIVGIFHDR
jgi:hypothetical protein